MTLQTDYSKAFSYARMQNGMPAVRSVILRNPGKEALTEMQLSIRFEMTLTRRRISPVNPIQPSLDSEIMAARLVLELGL